MDVSVLDDRGRPITDLKPEDFGCAWTARRGEWSAPTWIPLEAPPGPRRARRRRKAIRRTKARPAGG